MKHTTADNTLKQYFLKELKAIYTKSNLHLKQQKAINLKSTIGWLYPSRLHF